MSEKNRLPINAAAYALVAYCLTTAFVAPYVAVAQSGPSAPYAAMAQSASSAPYALADQDLDELRAESARAASDLQNAARREDGVFANGSFESGDLSGWIVDDIDDASMPLTVLESGWSQPGPSFFATEPTDGDFALVHGFDGEGPGTIHLAQDVTLPEGALTVSFDYRAGWDLLNWAEPRLNRSFVASIEPAGGGRPMQRDTILTASAGEMVVDTGDLHGSVDVSAFAQSSVRISFSWIVPETQTGPGFFQLDNVMVTPVSPDPQALIYPTELDLGVAAAGGVGASAIVSIRGVGAEEVTVTDISSSLEHIQLSDLPDLPLDLVSGETATFTVTFTPETAGDISGAVSIRSTDADNPELDVVLSGSAVDVATAEEGALYGAAIKRDFTGTGDGRLLEIDPGTGAASVIGPLDVPIADVAVNARGEMYGVYARQLYLIDPSTATTTHLSALAGSAGVITIAFSPEGKLYGLGSADISLGFAFNLFEIDPHTGHFTTVGEAMPLRFLGDYWTAMAFDPHDGTLWGAANSGDLYQMDRATGTPTLIGSNGFQRGGGNAQALHVDGRGELFSAITDDTQASTLLTLDQSDGAGTLVGPISPDRVQGLAGRHQHLTGPQLATLPERVDFRTAVVGSGGEQRRITLRNVGTEDVIISDITDPRTPFVLDDRSALPLVLPPGGTHTIEIAFIPTATGTFEETFAIASNDADDPESSIQLSGEVLQTAPAALGVTYVATDHDDSADLLTVDLQTGEGTVIGPTGLDGVTALAVSSGGELFGIEARTSDLYRIDPNTGEAAFAASIGVYNLQAAAFAPNDVLYGLAQDATTFDWRLFSIDPSTGAATAVGDSLPYFLSWQGMAFDPIDGQMWATNTGGVVYTIDLETASLTEIGYTELERGVPAIQFDDHGYLFGISGYVGGGPTSDLVAIDRTNGEATVLGPVGVPAVGAMDIRIEDLTGVHANIYPRQIDFGPAYVDSAGAVQNDVIRSVGTEALSVSISEPNAPFSVREFSSGTIEIPPGHADSLEVVFSPTIAGTFEAALTVNTDDPDAQSLEISLIGEGSTLPAAGTLFGVESFGVTNLVTIDRVNGEVSSSTAIPDLTSRIADIDFRRDGTLFASISGGIIRLDLLSGRPALVTSHEDGFLTALEFDEDGTLYGVYSSDPYQPTPPDGGFLSTLVIVDPASGAFTEIGRTGVEDITGVAFGDDGTLYGVTMQSGPRGSSEFVAIDTASGEASLIGSTGFVGVFGLEFAPDGTLYAGLANSMSAGGSLITLDPATGDGTLVGGAELSGLSGIAFFPEDSSTDVEENDAGSVPEAFSLHQNYPNPFNPTTTIRFVLPVTSHVTLDVFNVLGQRVAVLLDEKRAAGAHIIDFDGRSMPSGSYVYRLRAGDEVAYRSMLMVK